MTARDSSFEVPDDASNPVPHHRHRQHQRRPRRRSSIGTVPQASNDTGTELYTWTRVSNLPVFRRYDVASGGLLASQPGTAEDRSDGPMQIDPRTGDLFADAPTACTCWTARPSRPSRVWRRRHSARRPASSSIPTSP